MSRYYMEPDTWWTHVSTLLVVLAFFGIGFITFRCEGAAMKRREEIRSLPTITKRITTMGTVVLEIKQQQPGKWCVARVHYEGKDDEFCVLMCAAEYLSYIVATKSNLGFEKALDLVREGAMTWRHKGETLKPEE